MTDKPGFTVEEILQVKNSGNSLSAIKMLRAETGCSLLDATKALRDGNLEAMPTFKDLRARRKAERYGPQLLEVLKALSRTRISPDPEDYRVSLENAVRLIEEIEKE